MERWFLMNYQHEFHAGGIADVFKHIVLIAILESLHKKESAFCYIDTHGGAGIYDLSSEAAQKTGEYNQGIAKLIGHSVASPLITQYLNLVATCQNYAQSPRNYFESHTKITSENTTALSSIQYYPGSPFIARLCLRPQDRMIVIDQHPEIHLQLKQLFIHDSATHVHHRDGYQAMKAFLPPKENRGCILIDPPFENAQEFQHLVTHLDIALKRWKSGIFAVWFPIKNRQQINSFYKHLAELPANKILMTEFCPWPDDVTTRLNGSGMIVINPPWQIETILKPALQELQPYLQFHKNAQTKIQFIKQ